MKSFSIAFRQNLLHVLRFLSSSVRPLKHQKRIMQYDDSCLLSHESIGKFIPNTVIIRYAGFGIQSVKLSTIVNKS